MTTTTLRAAAARVRLVLSLIDWREALSITADGLRILWAAAQLVLTMLALAAAITWEHRAQIRAALVTAIAAAIVAAQLTLEAGRRTRHAVESIGRRSAALLPQQPLAAVAPITATLTAAREALERLLRRLYPVTA